MPHHRHNTNYHRHKTTNRDNDKWCIIPHQVGNGEWFVISHYRDNGEWCVISHHRHNTTSQR